MPRKKTKNTFRRGEEQRYIRYTHAAAPKRPSANSTIGIPVTMLLLTVIAAGGITMTVIAAPQITRQTSLLVQNIPSLPEISISKPQITLPSFSMPAISLPKISLPNVDVHPPSISIPSVNTDGVGKYASIIRSGLTGISTRILYGIQAFIRLLGNIGILLLRSFIQLSTALGTLVVASTTALWKVQISVMRLSFTFLSSIVKLLATGFVFMAKAIYSFLAGFARFMIDGVVGIANFVVSLFKLFISGIIAIGRGITGFFVAVGNKINAFNQRVSNGADATGKFFAPYITFINGSFQVAIDYFMTGLSDMNDLAGQLANEYKDNTKQFNEKKN
jgi:hypothetical protein